MLEVGEIHIMTKFLICISTEYYYSDHFKKNGADGACWLLLLKGRGHIAGLSVGGRKAVLPCN
jgi:hypothetical protein